MFSSSGGAAHGWALRSARFLGLFLASSFFYISSLVHDRQAAEDKKEEFFGIIRLA